MAYSINRTSDSGSGLNVSDGQLRDDALSISLIGKGFTNYGELIQENILHVMENFAHNIPPPHPTEGQLWFENSTDSLWIWKSGIGGWKDIQQPLPGRIFNVHINDDAKIDIYKLRPTLPARMIVGNASASAIPTWVDITGDIRVDATGNMQIQDNTINTVELGSVIDQSMTFGNFSTNEDRDLNVIAHDSKIASVNIYGATQGSARLFVGQQITTGGGVMYNGDNSPVMPGTTDYISHYRRLNGLDVEVFRYSTTSDQVDFHGEITTPRVRTGLGDFTYLENGLLNLQSTGTPRIELRSHDGGFPYIDWANSLVGGYDIRLQQSGDDDLALYGSSFHVGTTTQNQTVDVRVLASDGYIASLQAYGNANGTGMLYLGQSPTQGGGMIFNGDNSPSTVGTTDNIAFYRRTAGVDTEVFRFAHSNSHVYFNSNITLQGSLFINNTSTRVTEGAGNSIRLQTNYGFIDVGAQNSTWAHIHTDRSKFYMNKPIHANNAFQIYGTNSVFSQSRLVLESSGTPSIELRSTAGNNPYIDFSNDASTDYDMRLRLDGNDELDLQGGNFHVTDGSMIVGRITTTASRTITVNSATNAFFNAYGNSFTNAGMYFGQDTNFGGVLMYHATSDQVQLKRRSSGADTTVMYYTHNNSHVYFNSNITLQGSLFINNTSTKVTEGSNNSIRLQTNYGFVDVGPQSSTYSHFSTDRGLFHFNKGFKIVGNIDMSNYQLTAIKELEGQYGNIARSTDEYLRLNDGGTHTSGLIITGNINVYSSLYMNNNQIFGIKELEGQYGNIIKSTDEYLRLNDGGTHTSGVYINAPGLVMGGTINVNNHTLTNVGAISMNGVIDMNNNNINEIQYLHGQFGNIARSTDEYLRLNDGNTHTSGVYITSALRVDGTLNFYGHLYMNNKQIFGINELEGQYGNIAKSTDEYLRLNDGGTHTSGVYIGNNFRVDGSVGFGTNGNKFTVATNGNIYSAGSLSLGNGLDMNNKNITEIQYLHGQFGNIAKSTDEYLRLNDGNTHTSGVYITGPLRVDGTLNFYGHLYMNNKQIFEINELEGQYGNIARSTDEYLRLNDGGTHTSGVLIGSPGLVMGATLNMNSKTLSNVGAISMAGAIDMNNNNINEIRYLHGKYGNIARSTDEYLRLNDGNTHTSGVLIGGVLNAANGGVYIGTNGLSGSYGKLIHSSTSSYMILNGDNSHSSGVYTPGRMRMDGGIAAGGNGNAFTVSTSGVVEASGSITTANSLVALGTISVGKNGGGHSSIYFYDDNSNTTRRLYWNNTYDEFRVTTNTGTSFGIIHAGIINNFSISKTNSVSNAMTADIIYTSTSRDHSAVGTYDASKTQQIWAMGAGFKSSSTGSGYGSLYGLAYKHLANGGTHSINVVHNGVEVCSLGGYGIWTSGNVTAYSDRRVKENIRVIENALDKVSRISGYTFDRTDTDMPRQAGVIAQEVLEVLPEVVIENAEGMYSVAYGNMVGLLIEAIKEQQTIINTQQETINSFDERLKRLEK